MTAFLLFCMGVATVLLWGYIWLVYSRKRRASRTGAPPPTKQPVVLEKPVITYSFFDTAQLEKPGLRFMYYYILKKTHWFDEPFHRTFFFFLCILQHNHFFIAHPNAKPLTLNLRDAWGKPFTAYSYRAYSTIAIAQTSLRRVMDLIHGLEKEEAQDTVVAICVLCLQYSTHQFPKKAPTWVIGKLLDQYEQKEKVNTIIASVHKKDGLSTYAKMALEHAFEVTATTLVGDNECENTTYSPSGFPYKRQEEFPLLEDN